jgi:hypothetical protein
MHAQLISFIGNPCSSRNAPIIFAAAAEDLQFSAFNFGSLVRFTLFTPNPLMIEIFHN